MTNDLYILDDQGNPVEEPDIHKWGEWFENTSNRRVALDKIGDAEVSTVFLAIDHNFFHRGNPLLWETMVFGGEFDQEQDRCSGSREQAEAMHKRMVDKVKGQNYGCKH